jgi:flagellar biosynthesis/type III secretory pathway chaperone
MSADIQLDTAVRAILDRDAVAIDTLNSLLLNEREALKKRDATAINELVTRKLDCLKAMELIDRERKLCVRRARAKDWPSLIAALDPDHKTGIADRWSELVVRLREAAELTEINARIVSRTRHSTERMLAILRGQTEPVGVYDKLGKTHAYGDVRPIVSA